MQNDSAINLNHLNSTDEIAGIYWTKMPAWVGYVEISYLFVIMLIGIPGNSLIICVQSRNRDKSSTDYLIVMMAVYELVCCSITTTLQISMNTTLWIYIASNTLCRFYYNVVYITTFTSTFLLAAIAVDRYIKTCKPLSNVYNVTTSKRVCAVAAVYGFVTGISGYFVIEVDKHLECNIAEKYLQLQFFWDMCLVLSTVVVFSIFVFTYVNIALTLHERVRNRKRARYITVETSSKQHKMRTVPNIFQKSKSRKVEPVLMSVKTVVTSSGINHSSNWIADVQISKQAPSCSTYGVMEEGSTNHRATNQPAKFEKTVNRTTLMLFVLTIIYTITFTLTNIFVMTGDTILGSIMVKLCKSLLMINCITNAVCFFCMSSKYRASVKHLLFRQRTT